MTLTRFAWLIFRPYRFYLGAIMCIGLSWGLYNSASPYILKTIVDQLAEAKPMAVVYKPTCTYVVLYFLMAMLLRLLDWVKYKIMPPIKKDIAMQMFNYIKYHSHDYFQNSLAGSISNQVNDMVVNLESLLNQADEFFAIFSQFVSAIIVMAMVNGLFATALVCWWLCFIGISMWFSRRILLLSRKTSASYSRYSGMLVDILANIASVRLFARFQYETSKLTESVDDLVMHDRNMLRYIIIMRMMLDIASVCLLFTMLYLLIYLYQVRQVSIGDFVLILMVTVSIFQGMWYLANKIVDVYKSIGKCHQAMSLLEVKHGLADLIDATPLVVRRGDITFNSVSFSYAAATKLFLDTSVTIAAGTKVGLVGYSGSGKSSFINLILRLYDLNAGEILIDGQNIQTVTQQSLREQVSMIPQDVNLFHRSLMDNIRYGDVSASEQQVIAAAGKAYCHEFISQLEQGYETIVGERGIKLSGGQRQRIAIARALLENAPILLLDEATSALDSVTEKYVQKSLRVAMEDRTAIIIAHRLSTLLEVDRILVFQHGQIIEDGSHNELIQINGHYARIWAMQSNGFLPSDDVS